jgi:hypothetical protein
VSTETNKLQESWKLKEVASLTLRPLLSHGNWTEYQLNRSRVKPKAGTRTGAAKSGPDWNPNRQQLLLYSWQMSPKPEISIFWRILFRRYFPLRKRHLRHGGPAATVPSPWGNPVPVRVMSVCPRAELCTNKLHCLLVLLAASTRVLISAAYSVHDSFITVNQLPTLYGADGKMIMNKKKAVVAYWKYYSST